jgi:hypothetical protein
LQTACVVLFTRPSIEFIHVHAFVISRVLRTVSAADAARLPTPCIQPLPYWSSGVCPVRLVLPCGLCCVLSFSNRSAQSTAALQQGPVLLDRRGPRSVGQATIWLLYTNDLLGGRSSGPGAWLRCAEARSAGSTRCCHLRWLAACFFDIGVWLSGLCLCKRVLGWSASMWCWLRLLDEAALCNGPCGACSACRLGWWCRNVRQCCHLQTLVCRLSFVLAVAAAWFHLLV